MDARLEAVSFPENVQSFMRHRRYSTLKFRTDKMISFILNRKEIRSLNLRVDLSSCRKGNNIIYQSLRKLFTKVGIKSARA